VKLKRANSSVAEIRRTRRIFYSEIESGVVNSRREIPALNPIFLRIP
jgi:hypothetical protein